MSHTTTIKGIKLKDINAIKAAVAELKAEGVNIELGEKITPRMYYTHQAAEVGVCDYVLKLPACRFDVGLKKQEDGSYAPVFDEHAGYVAGQIGAQCPLPKDRSQNAQHQIGRFMNSYTKHAILNQARAEGRQVRSIKTNAQGQVVLELAGYR